MSQKMYKTKTDNFGLITLTLYGLFPEEAKEIINLYHEIQKKSMTFKKSEQ